MVSPRDFLLVGMAVWALAAAASGCQLFDRDSEFLRVSTARDPQRAATLHSRGVRLAKAGKMAEAETAFKNALLVDPEFGAAHNNLGLVQYHRGDLYQAAWSFEKAVQYLPDRAEPINNLGLTYEAASRLDEAIAMYDTAATLAPANAVYLGNLLRARLRRGDSDPSVHNQFREFLFLEKRPEWLHWAEEQIALFVNERAASSPTVVPPGDLPRGAEPLPPPGAPLPAVPTPTAPEPIRPGGVLPSLELVPPGGPPSVPRRSTSERMPDRGQ